MPSSLSDRVTRAWYHGAWWLALLFPLMLLYWFVISIRRGLYKLGVKSTYRSSLPVVVVGNITLGGTGKSPLVSYLVESLQARGYRPGIVSRGYGSDIGADECREVLTDSAVEAVGDEPLMLKRRLGCPVFVSPNRQLSLQAIEQAGCNIVVTDDGLQHYAMDRDIEICVTDGARKLGNGYLLPMGPLREGRAQLSRVDFNVVNGSDWQPCEGNTFKMDLEVDELKSLQDDKVAPPQGKEVHAVAGIGNPERFFSTLRNMGYSLETHAFDDHYAFKVSDFEFSKPLPIIMTEKDAVKCRGLGIENAWYLPVNARVDDALVEGVITKLKQKGYLNG